MTMSIYSEEATRILRPDLRLPDFLIIGASKSATSTLQSYLQRHPDVFMSTPKEPEFFSRETVYARGLDWYAGLFDDSETHHLLGEASTPYTYFPLTPNVPERISRVMPEAKFIYSMRHPVDRAFSHYKHDMRTGVQMSFEEALVSREDLHQGWDGRVYLDGGRYISQINEYLKYFPRESFLFLLYEDLISSTESVLETCQQFLGLEVRDLMAGGSVHSNVGDTEHYVRNYTTQQLRRIPGVNALADVLSPKLRADAYRIIRDSRIGKHLAKKGQVQPMLAETRARLLELFEEPNLELAEFLGRDLSGWNK